MKIRICYVYAESVSKFHENCIDKNCDESLNKEFIMKFSKVCLGKFSGNSLFTVRFSKEFNTVYIIKE